MIKTYQYTDFTNTTIKELDSGSLAVRFIPVDSGNSDYMFLVNTAATIDPFGIDPVQAQLDFQSSILNVVSPDPFSGVSGTVVVSGGLNLVTNVPNLIVNDVTSVQADPSFTKNVLISVVYETVSGTFSVVAREKTTDVYATLLEKELNVKDLGEFFVTAGGSTLIPV
jgi:hypothetical protein